MSEIKEPFLTVLHLGGSVDYKDKGAKTHEFVKKFGYEPKMNADCSITADGLKGINLTSYGDWGRVYSFLMDKTSADIFKQMVDEGVVELWRARICVIRRPFYYEDGKGWTTFDETEKKWVSCDELAIVTEYKNKKQNEKQIYFNELTY